MGTEVHMRVPVMLDATGAMELALSELLIDLGYRALVYNLLDVAPCFSFCALYIRQALVPHCAPCIAIPAVLAVAVFHDEVFSSGVLHKRNLAWQHLWIGW